MVASSAPSIRAQPSSTVSTSDSAAVGRCSHLVVDANDEKGRAKPGIAVLPFKNLSGDPATARLASGLTEDIITDFARYRGFDVIARNSVEQYTGSVDIRSVGNLLNVSYVMQGSVQRQDNRIRISSKLTSTDTGAVTSSERWDRPMGDFFAVQTELSGQVATRLGGL